MDKPTRADPGRHPPKKQGSSAQFSWQTILILRLAIVLKGKFRLELQAHRTLFNGLRRSLKGRSFIALWDQALVLRSPADWSFVAADSAETLQDDAILVRLNPHLEVLAAGFALPSPRSLAGQLDLFPAVPLNGQADAGRTSAVAKEPTTLRQRRSA